MYHENTVLERPKQLNIGGKGKYCSIPVCTNAQYDKDWQKTNIGLLKFPFKDEKQELYKLWCNKIKTFCRAGGKYSFKVSNNANVCEFPFNINYINVSAGRHIKIFKPNVVPSVFTFIKNESPENQLKQRSPRKRHLNAEFVKPKQKKLSPQIIDAIALQTIVLKVINGHRVVVLFAKTMRSFHLKICCLKKKLKYWKKKKIDLKKN